MFNGYGYLAFHDDPALPALRIEVALNEAFVMKSTGILARRANGDPIDALFVYVTARRSNDPNPFYKQLYTTSSVYCLPGKEKQTLLTVAAQTIDDIANGWKTSGYKLFRLGDFEAQAARLASRPRTQRGRHGR